MSDESMQTELTSQRPAFVGRRIVAFIIDYFAFFVILYVLALFILPEATRNSPENIINLTVIITLWVLVIVLPEGLLGYTLGKGAVNLRVVKLRDADSMLTVSLKRHCCDFIEVFLFFGVITIIMIITSTQHQRIGDHFARSIVVKDI